LRSKLESQTKERKKVGGKHALVKIEDALLKQYIGYMYPRLRNVGMRDFRRDRKVVNDGISAGKRLVISKGITERGIGRRLLIEN